jgi:hypothetical protein
VAIDVFLLDHEKAIVANPSAVKRWRRKTWKLGTRMKIYRKVHESNTSIGDRPSDNRALAST